MNSPMIRWVMNRMPKSDDSHLSIMDVNTIKKVHAFHKSFPQYAQTPLCALNHAAGKLGLKGLFVKDESHRFGLCAFKVLGGSYAIAAEMAKAVGLSIDEIDYARLTDKDLRDACGQSTFFTATDGNHGRGVAWAARMLGQKAVVLMPKGTAPARLEHIAREGADVTIMDVNYDECVRLASAMAEKTERSIVIQDTAWQDYEDIPCRIMQGYGTMAREAAQQLVACGVQRPTHVLIQAGVGSLAGAVQGYYANLYGKDCPKVIVLEAQAADCHYQSAQAGDGSIRIVTGDLSTMMAGLACGEPNPISFDILKNHAACFVSCPDWVSASGMRLLARPVGEDPAIVSGESGAVGMGFIHAVMTDPAYSDLKEALELDHSSVVLMFSTEGATDPENYHAIVDNPSV